MFFSGQDLLLGGHWWYLGQRVQKYSVSPTDLKENRFWEGKLGHIYTLLK